MSQVRANSITNSAGTGAPDFPNGLTNNGVAVTSGGMTLLGTLTTTSGSTQTLSGLTLTDYKIIYFSAAGISAAAATEVVLAGFTVVYLPAAVDTFSGIGFLDISGSNGQAVRHSVGSSTGTHTLTTASTSISVTASSSTFDAGSIRIYGVK